MDYKKSYLLFNCCLYAGLALCIVSLMTKVTWVGIIGTIVIVLGMLQTVIFYRCPNCHKVLNYKGRKPKHCPECGHKLFDM